MNLKKGQRVKLTADGRTVDATVVIASQNGNALMLTFEAWLLGHVGMMAVFREEDGTYHTVLGWHEIKIEVLQ